MGKLYLSDKAIQRYAFFWNSLLFYWVPDWLTKAAVTQPPQEGDISTPQPSPDRQPSEWLKLPARNGQTKTEGGQWLRPTHCHKDDKAALRSRWPTEDKFPSIAFTASHLARYFLSHLNRIWWRFLILWTAGCEQPRMMATWRWVMGSAAANMVRASVMRRSRLSLRSSSRVTPRRSITLFNLFKILVFGSVDKINVNFWFSDPSAEICDETEKNWDEIRLSDEQRECLWFLSELSLKSERKQGETTEGPLRG